MAKQYQGDPEDQSIDLIFPVEGVEVVRAFHRQRPGTTPGAQNVRAFEPGTGRARGGARRGSTRYFDGTVNGVFPIQCLDHLTITNASVPPTQAGLFTYAQVSGSGFSVGSTAGVNQWTAGVTASSRFEISCWDAANNVYAVFRNTSTGATVVYKYNYLGALQWSVAGLTFQTGTGRVVAGLCVIGTTLYLAAMTSATVGAIHKINTATGALTTNWVTSTGTFTRLRYSTASVGVLASIGNLLGVEVIGSGSNTQGFFVFDTTKVPTATGGFTFLAWGGTSSNARSKVVSDGLANFYCIASVTASQVRQVSATNKLGWTTTAGDTAQCLCYDYGANLLVAVFTSSTSLKSLSLSAGTVLASSNPGTVTSWSMIDSDNQGNFTLWSDSVASNDVMGVNTTFSTVWGPSTFANTLHSGSSVNRGPVTQPTPTGGLRQIRPVVIANGEFRTFSPAGSQAVTNGQSFNPNIPQIFSCQNGVNLYICDGNTYQYYNSLTNTIAAYVASAGTMPVDAAGLPARIIELWRGRNVLLGFPKQPNLWAMSAVNNPSDMDFQPATTSVTQAIQGTLAQAGLPGDALMAFIPYSNDVGIFCCSHSMYSMTGDPAAGGQIDRISDVIGTPFGRPWCKDPVGQVYFLSSAFGIFKMQPGALPTRVSQQIEPLIDKIDFSSTVIQMAWDIQNQGLAVWVTPTDPTQATTNFFWEERTNSWQPDAYANTLHNPLVVHVLEGDSPSQRQVMMGGRDGVVRIQNQAATTDDGIPIQSYVILGPVKTPELDEILLTELHAIMGQFSGSVQYDIYVGDSPESAFYSAPVLSLRGTWLAGRNHTTPVQRSGAAAYVKVSSTNPWAMERVNAIYRPLGLVRRRQ